MDTMGSITFKALLVEFALPKCSPSTTSPVERRMLLWKAREPG